MTASKQLLLSTLIGAALGSNPIRAEDPASPPVTTPAAKAAEPVETVKVSEFVALKKQIESLQKDIKDLQVFRKDLEDTVLGDKDGAAGKNPGLLAKIAELESTIKKLNSELTAMDKKVADAAKKTTSAYTPGLPSNPMPTPTSTSSTVRIVNEYPVEISMIVNKKAYRVAASETRTVEVPSGSYTYELLTAGSAPTTSTIKDGETVTLRIR